MENASILIKDGRIAKISPRPIDTDAPKVDAKGRVVTAGLWNNHVHFTMPELLSKTQAILTDMLLKYGFTSVVDTGSDPTSTQRLSKAIEDGKLKGPRIIMANGSFVFTDGTPTYLPGIKLPEIGTPEAAAPAVNAVLDGGSHGIKIFSGSFISPTKTVLLPPKVVHAITKAAHARKSFVIAHPTDADGLAGAINNGVDVLAHTAPPAGPFDDKTLKTIIDNKIALIPTLKLWRWELSRFNVPEPGIKAYQNNGVAQLKAVHDAGGTILFGTDVGYMSDYDTSAEYKQMARAGMDFKSILTALTTAPAALFVKESGKVETGALGDLAIYDASPVEDTTNFAAIAMTIRGGRIVFGADEK
ncbi:MAG: amidohydrolase family protein [Pseudomonadota bacterium]